MCLHPWRGKSKRVEPALEGRLLLLGMMVTRGVWEKIWTEKIAELGEAYDEFLGIPELRS